MEAKVVVQDPRESIQQIMQENTRLKQRLEQERALVEEMREERAASKELVAKLKPYADLLDDDGERPYMNVTLREPGVITMLLVRARQLKGQALDVDSENKDLARQSRLDVDQIVQQMVISGLQRWPYIVNELRKRD